MLIHYIISLNQNPLAMINGYKEGDEMKEVFSDYLYDPVHCVGVLIPAVIKVLCDNIFKEYNDVIWKERQGFRSLSVGDRITFDELSIPIVIHITNDGYERT